MNKKNRQIQVIGFVTLDTEPTNKPLPDDYLCESGLPNEMIELMAETNDNMYSHVVSVKNGESVIAVFLDSC